MRRRIRRKNQRSKQIIIISTMCLFLCLCVGYAAFQTNITITAKGNILCSGEDAKDKIIADSLDSGSGLSGLYEDSYETGRYVYRGAEVNNYITFNNQTWRIIAIESDGTLKIVKNDSIGSMTFDSQGNRDSSSNGAGGTYCSSSSSYGCNVWAATANMVGSQETFINGTASGTVLLDSSLNTYLNGDYYNGLNSDAQKLIEKYPYNIGGVSYTSSLTYTVAEMLEDEDDYTWTGKVALINMSDYIRSNSNDGDNCNTLYGNYSSTYYTTCRTTTWMYTSLSATYWWTITPRGSYTSRVWRVGGYGNFSNNNAYNAGGVRPVVHLTSDLKLCGSGTEEEPYTIVA